MPDIKFGKKHVCSNCGVKFYDLNRKPATCPSCGTEYTEPSNETITTKAKQVFVDDVDTVTDNNLVGSNATESIAELSVNTHRIVLGISSVLVEVIISPFSGMLMVFFQNLASGSSG